MKKGCRQINSARWNGLVLLITENKKNAALLRTNSVEKSMPKCIEIDFHNKKLLKRTSEPSRIFFKRSFEDGMKIFEISINVKVMIFEKSITNMI